MIHPISDEQFKVQPHLMSLMSFKSQSVAKETTLSSLRGINMWPVESVSHPYSRGSILRGSVLIEVFQMRTWR